MPHETASPRDLCINAPFVPERTQYDVRDHPA